jgi:hypothetical protein
MTQIGMITYDVPTAIVESQSRKKDEKSKKKKTKKTIFIYSAFHASLNLREGRWRTTGVSSSLYDGMMTL